MKGLVCFPPFSPLQTKLPTSSHRKHEQNLWTFFYDVAVFLSVFFLTVFRKYPVHTEDYPPGQPPALCYSRGPGIVLLFVGLGRTQRYSASEVLESCSLLPTSHPGGSLYCLSQTHPGTRAVRVRIFNLTKLFLFFLTFR